MFTFKKKLKLMKYNKNSSVSYNLTEEQSYTLSLYAQLILDEACYKYNQERLKASIDKAIDNKDQQEFMNKSNEYQNLVSRNT